MASVRGKDSLAVPVAAPKLDRSAMTDAQRTAQARVRKKAARDKAAAVGNEKPKKGSSGKSQTRNASKARKVDREKVSLISDTSSGDSYQAIENSESGSSEDKGLPRSDEVTGSGSGFAAQIPLPTSTPKDFTSVVIDEETPAHAFTPQPPALQHQTRFIHRDYDSREPQQPTRCESFMSRAENFTYNVLANTASNVIFPHCTFGVGDMLSKANEVALCIPAMLGGSALARRISHKMDHSHIREKATKAIIAGKVVCHLGVVAVAGVTFHYAVKPYLPDDVVCQSLTLGVAQVGAAKVAQKLYGLFGSRGQGSNGIAPRTVSNRAPSLNRGGHD